MRNDQTYTRQTGEVAVTASMTVCDLADEPTAPAPLCFRTRRPSPERWARLPGRCFDVGVGVLSEKREPVAFLVSSKKSEQSRSQQSNTQMSIWHSHGTLFALAPRSA